MCLSGLEVNYPSYETLKRYATEGCPVKTGRNWTKEDINAAVMRGSHDSALSEEAIAHFSAEPKLKVAPNQARLVFYKNSKVIYQQKWRFHQLWQSLTSQNHPDQ